MSGTSCPRTTAGADRAAGAFTIVPARDELGSNAVLCSPADAVPLRFGDNSFFPHLDAAKAHGIEPEVVHLPRIALDIDTPEDLALFLRHPVADPRARAARAWRIRDDRTGEQPRPEPRRPAHSTRPCCQYFLASAATASRSNATSTSPATTCEAAFLEAYYAVAPKYFEFV